MNNAKSEYLLWRVDWFHRDGYQAPYQLIETKKNSNRAFVKREAHAKAKKASRLADFPKFWSYRLTELNKDGE